MKNLFIPLLTMSVLLVGCPYESANPLSEPNVKVPSSILGTYEKKGAETDAIVTAKVEKITDFHFLMTEVTNFPATAETDEMKDTVFYVSFLTKIDNDYFINNLAYSPSNLDAMNLKIDELKSNYKAGATASTTKIAPKIVVDTVAAEEDFEIDEYPPLPDMYYIFKVDGNFTDNKFRLRGLTKNLTNEIFKSSNDLYNYVAKYKGLSILYDKDEIYTYFRLSK